MWYFTTCPREWLARAPPRMFAVAGSTTGPRLARGLCATDTPTLLRSIGCIVGAGVLWGARVWRRSSGISFFWPRAASTRHARLTRASWVWGRQLLVDHDFASTSGPALESRAPLARLPLCGDSSRGGSLGGRDCPSVECRKGCSHAAVAMGHCAAQACGVASTTRPRSACPWRLVGVGPLVESASLSHLNQRPSAQEPRSYCSRPTRGRAAGLR